MAMINIELDNNPIISKQTFKEFKNASVSTKFYWRHEDRLIGWNDSNNDRTYWHEVDARIRCITFANGTKTYELYVDHELVAGEIIELSYETDDQNHTKVDCSIVSIWD